MRGVREGVTAHQGHRMWLSKERECVTVNLVRIFLVWSISLCILWGGRSLVYDCRGGICLVAVG
jgi:hypothetical protein